MRAIAVSEYKADARLAEYDRPIVGPGQALIRVEAAGMNPLDQAIASGAFSELFPATFPLILGVDVVGVIEDVGRVPSPYGIGDRVFGQLLSPPLGASGAYADYTRIDADATVASVPDTLTSEVAAALPTPGVTALQLERLLEPSATKTIAVAGAGGAVGGFLTQLLATSGARVMAFTLPEQTDRVRGYGAHLVIDDTTVPADQLLRAAPSGIDALVDLVSDPGQFALLSDTVRPGGTAISTRYVADIESLAKKDIQGLNFVVEVTIADLQSVAALAASGSCPSTHSYGQL